MACIVIIRGIGLNFNNPVNVIGHNYVRVQYRQGIVLRNRQPILFSL